MAKERRTIKDRITAILRPDESPVEAPPKREVSYGLQGYDIDVEKGDDYELNVLFAMNEEDRRREVYAELSDEESGKGIIE